MKEMSVSSFAESTVLIVGLGMIGGSVARGLKQRNPHQQILAVDTDQQQLDLATEQGIIEQGSLTVKEFAAQADVIVIAVPTLAIGQILVALEGTLKPGAVITDVASVKEAVMTQAQAKLGDSKSRFVPSHPIAGSEKSGFGAASGDLFANRKVIITPEPYMDADAIQTVHQLWRRLGADVLGMTVRRHDDVLAATSHLPHLLSYALVDVLVKSKRNEDIFRYAAGGFADFSRLASSDPTMWADIFVANSRATTAVLDEYIEHLQLLRKALVNKEHGFLKTTFTQAKAARDSFVQKIFNPMAEPTAQESRLLDYVVAPGGQVTGDIRVPGDKSISHRAVIFGSLARGVTEVSGFLEGEDALNTLDAFREMGVTIVGPEDGKLTIYGVGREGLQAPRKPLYMGNSGTAMRLLAGLLAAQPFPSQLTGDESLLTRPMQRIADPLGDMGARVDTARGGTPPLTITGTRLHGIDYEMPMASAQVKSCLLFAAMYVEGETRIREPAPCRDHTERMLKGFGYPVETNSATGEVIISGGHELTASDIDIPSDISSAAFFMVAAAISPGSKLLLRHVGVNPTRTGIITLLELMGADIQLSNTHEVGGEPVADILVQHAPLRGIEVPRELIPLAIGEFPALFIAAACAEGTTRLRGAEELRVKESDRLQAMANGLDVLGIKNTLVADGIDIVGGAIGGGEVDSAGDHRIAMAFTIAALRSSAAITIGNCSNVATSFPGFVPLANKVGVAVQIHDQTDSGAD
ncbi:MAG: bifunctional prephenate dehydrogenase/3-phosphoshikimate 1-carboxyvinyltransferase [Gammaproteobacteria bacterium]|nr:bifunctional prephenate dehydrogenase/3-phosphoshikimate 1-carboxyvinyltransferase [Gammaproteobacteria bacterium]